MASRRKLKKTITFVSNELITDVYFRCLMSNKIDEAKVDKIVLEIADANREYVLRANRPTGKDNPKMVKKYYRSLYDGFQKAMEKIVEKMEKL